MTPVQHQCHKFLSELLKGHVAIGANVARSVSDSFGHLTSGYAQDPVQILTEACMASRSRDIIRVKNIRFFSLCEHHLLPFYGTADIIYQPQKKIAGLGKFPKALEALSLRLQLQESLTQQLADAIQKVLEPRACAVRLDAFHFCLSMRGAKERDARMQTLGLRGAWAQDSKEYQNIAKLFG